MGTPVGMAGLGQFGVSPKNTMSQAAMDLGMGDALKQQLEDELAERRKQQGGSAAGPADTNAMSPAALALFGKMNGFGT